MYPQDPTQLPPPPMPPAPGQPIPPADDQSGKHAIHNPLSVMEPGERMICEIKRHPIGMIGIYTGAGFLLIVLAVIAFGVAPSVITNVSKGEVLGLGAVIYAIFAIFCLAFVAISNKVYWGNSWVVTSDSITQITQTSLFHKQSSQLSLGNLEDVTADQDGPISHMFNFGTLKVETAGERSKFMFLYCPKPNDYAQQILSARERFEQGRSNDNPQDLYHGQGSYQNVQPVPTLATPTYQQPAAPAYQPPAPQPVAQTTYGLPQYQAPPANPVPDPANPQPYQGYQFPAPGPDDTPGVNIDTQS